MEYVTGIVDSVKKWIKGPDRPTIPAGWSYETFREYALAISRGRDYLLPIEEYPSRLELNGLWHETFNQIRPKTYESWALIGYEEGQRRLVLPTVAEKGLSHSVPYEVMIVGINKAKSKAGITDFIGDIHSHPREHTDPSWHVPSIETSEGNGAFSLGDLYGLLRSLSEQRPSDTRRSCMFVTEGNENITAFATRRTLERVRNSFSGSYEEFAQKWYKRYKWDFKGMSLTTGEVADPTEHNSPKLWAINKGVAYHYQLALYRGFTNKP